MLPVTLHEKVRAVQSPSPLAKSAWISWGSKGVLTLTDQGLIGGSNFLIAILLARQLSPSHYGAYALAFEIFMVTSMAYSCLILEPMLVFGSSTHQDNFSKYFGVLLWMHLAAILAISVLLGATAWLIYELGRSSSLPKALTGVMLAVPSVLFFWLIRRAFYVKLNPKASVLGGILYSAVLLGGIWFFYNLQSLSPFLAFLLMAAGALAASLPLLGRLKPSMTWRPTSPTLHEVGSMHWTYGRWSLAAAVATWISGNIYYILLSSVRGLADTGALKALLNLASPVGQVFAALSMLVLPYAARSYHKSRAAGVKRFCLSLTALYAGGTFAYWVVLFLLRQPALHFLYSGKYAQVEYLIPYVALASVLRISTVVPIVTLKAMQAPFIAFVAFVFSDIAACFVGVPAIWIFGLQGAIWTYVLSGAIGLLSGFILLRRTVRRDGQPELPFPEVRRSAQSDVVNVG